MCPHNFPTSDFVEIRSAILQLLHAYRRTDGAILSGIPKECERSKKGRLFLRRLLNEKLHPFFGIVPPYLKHSVQTDALPKFVSIGT
jgi:hypothetical protein